MTGAPTPRHAARPEALRAPPSLRATVLVTLAAVGAFLALLFPGAIFRGEVLSQADSLLQHEPWRAVAPEGFVPGNPELSDQATQFQPWNLLLRESLARGELPLWNPRAGAGQPLLANLQSAVLSPFTALSLLFPFGAGLLVAACAQLLCAGLGTALFARRLGASLPACVLAALAYTCGGFQFLWLQHPHAAVSCWLPWLLLLADLWARAPDPPARRWLRPLLALGVAALIVGGHAETALHVALAVAAWALLASAGRPWAARVRLVLDMGVWSLAGAALAGLQLLPFVEYLHLSQAYAQRSGFREVWRRVPWEQAPALAGAALLLLVALLACRRAVRVACAPEPRRTASVLAWTALALGLGAATLALLGEAGFSPLHRLLFHPDAYGHPVPARGMPFDGPRAYVNVNNGYAGVLVLPLALFALVCGPRGHRGVRALGWLWLGAFLIAYELPVASQLVNRLPLLDLALNYRFTLVVGFAGAVLAAFGLDALRDAAARARPAAAFWVLGTVIAGALALAPLLGNGPELHGYGMGALGYGLGAHGVEPRWWLLGAVALLLLAWGTWPGATKRGALLPLAGLALLGADLFLFGRGVHPSAPADRLYPPNPVTDFLRAQPDGGRVWAVGMGLLMPNTAGVYGLSDLRAFDALGVERMGLLQEALLPPAAVSSAGSPDGERVPMPGEDVDVASSLFDLLDVRFVLAPAAWTPPDGAQLTRELASGDSVVWRNERARGRAWFAGSAWSIDDYLSAPPVEAMLTPEVRSLPPEARQRQRRLEVARALGHAYRPAWSAQHALLIEGDAPRMPLARDQDAHDGPPGGAELRWIADEPQHVELGVTAEAPGWLGLADACFPGWQATVNGAPAEIVPAFLGLRAVRVPAGESRVRFDYAPASVRYGLLLSAAGALVVLAGAGLALRRRGRSMEGR